MDGALMVDKHAGVSSFGVIEELQRILFESAGVLGRSAPFTRKRDLPKMGHGGTLDPFATGLLAVCVGRGVKLARYFLGSGKTYEGVIRFGETTVPGDCTAEISERSEHCPARLAEVREAAHAFTLGPYLQTPPMHSAKKKNGKPLYELARRGIEIPREPKPLRVHRFEITSYERPRAAFRVECSSGTYVRTLAKDLASRLGTVAMLDSLHRVECGSHRLANGAMSVEDIRLASRATGARWDRLPAWVPFDRLLDGCLRAEAMQDEATALFQGRQSVLPVILSRAETPLSCDPVAIYCASRLIAVARQDGGAWGLERVFAPGED